MIAYPANAGQIIRSGMLREEIKATIPRHNGKDLDMIERDGTRHRKVPIRTIVAAIAMLVGIVLLTFGYSQTKQVMIYLGVLITLSGVMTEAVFGIIGGTRERRRGRIAKA